MILSFLAGLSTHPLFSDDFGGLERTNNGVIQLDPIEIGGGGEEVIPKPPKQLTYRVEGKAKAIASGGFQPYHDAPSFVNFASIASSTDEGQKFSSGTCYGVSYMTSIWYAGMVRHLKEMKPKKGGPEVEYIGNRDLKFGKEYDSQAQICNPSDTEVVNCSGDVISSQMPEQNIDGLTYLASMAKLSDPRFFNKCGKGLAKCRLFEVSRNVDLKDRVQQTMIHHHNQQYSAEDVELKVANPNRLHAQIEDIKTRVRKHGSVFFYWYVYNTKEKWGGDTGVGPEDVEWNQFESGHAMLIYRVSKVKAKVSGKTREALKLHLYDPNKTYRSKRKLVTGEGYGTYLLYFPDSKTITFGNSMQKLYSEDGGAKAGDAANIAKNLQGGFPTIDGKQTIIGFSDFYEGHITQFGDAADMLTFATSRVSTGKDEALFQAFAMAKNCEAVKKQVKAVKNADKTDGGHRTQELETWIASNYQAFQNHLRSNDVIDDNEDCNPFE